MIIQIAEKTKLKLNANFKLGQLILLLGTKRVKQRTAGIIFPKLHFELINFGVEFFCSKSEY